jgi:co-chaperonin GroES (HSP10)
MILKPLRNNVMFKFLDETAGKKGAFTETSISGIIIPRTNSTQKVSRWGQVYAAGPDADVVAGDYILIEALMWMEGVVYEGEKIWKTDDTKILAVTDDRAACQSQAL